MAASPLLLGACGGPSENVRELKDDPFAHYVPAGGHLVKSRGENEHTTFGKPSYASYRRMFEIPRAEPERQLRQALDAASAAGWAITDSEPFRLLDHLSQGGHKRLPTGRRDLGITVFPTGTPSDKTHRPTMLI